MCGIAGFYLRQQSADLSRLRSMTDQIRYRGPDDEGFHIDGGCGIGMRRLSIIDLGTGHQPISNEDETVWTVFNGEIYNYRAIRPELIAQGHRLKTQSDTEMLVHLYEQYGVESPKHLRGMFAYAIWDASSRSLFLARDRFGKKPLYYAVLPEGLFFGSELKCLRAAGVPMNVDREALRLYFQFSYIPDPWTPFQEVRKLAPGGWLRYRADGRVETGRFWTLPAPAEEPPPGVSEDRMCERIREVFDESVRLRLIADVPLGAFLSGGLDSASVVASMARQSDAPVKTFTIGFEEAGYNELPAARLVSERYHTDHHEIMVSPDAINLVGQLVRHFDEPFGDSSAIPTYCVSRFAASHVKVALTGDGGDELFGGYESFFALVNLRRFDRVPVGLRRILSAIADLLPYSAYGKNYMRMISRPSALERYFELNYAPYFLRRQLLEPEWMLPADAAFLKQTFAQCLLTDADDILTRALYFEATAKLTGDMLVKVDRMSMANSLEVRSPLLDHELAELAAQIPHAWKFNGTKGKLILRKALGERLPQQLLALPKKGFGVPLDQWFRGPLRDFLYDHLGSSGLAARDIVSPPFLDHLLTEHREQRRDNSHWLWILLMLELWFQDIKVPASMSPALSAH